MGDWNKPTNSSDYATEVLSNLNDKDVDSSTLAESPTNPPTRYVRYNRSLNKFQYWDGAAWQDYVLSVAGGGTGSGTASGARTNLGLGDMATQTSSSVSITGGSISGVSMNASVLTAGMVALNRGGTGASLSLGSIGQILLSNGSSVIFSDGDQIAKLNASNLTTGTVPLARLSNIANAQISSSAAIAWSKIDKTGALFSDLSGTLPNSALSGGNYTGTVGIDTLGVANGCGIGGNLSVTGTFNTFSGISFTNIVNDFNSVVAPTTGHIAVTIDGVARLIAFY